MELFDLFDRFGDLVSWHRAPSAKGGFVVSSDLLKFDWVGGEDSFGAT